MNLLATWYFLTPSILFLPFAQVKEGGKSKKPTDPDIFQIQLLLMIKVTDKSRGVKPGIFSMD